MTRLANPCVLSESRLEAPGHRDGGDAAEDGQDNVRAVPERGSGELPLTLRERIVLGVGLWIAGVLISLVERPSTIRIRGEMSRSKIAGRVYLSDGEWPSTRFSPYCSVSSRLSRCRRC